MTGPATFSSLLTSERPAMNLPRDLAGLRSECSKRKLPTSGSKEELVSRISAHELISTRSFSSGVENSKRPIPSPSEAGGTVRHFNTSRSLKAVGDSSTIDFAYIPDFDPDSQSAPVAIRVPILPQTTVTYTALPEEAEEAVMLPTIHTVAADSTHIHAPAALSELADSNHIDFQGMASYAAKKLSRDVEEGAGMARQLWGGLMEDIWGPKTPARA
ncbi:hypothetical protein CC80DRAFT_493002 [Byssothecium circinans]|uniref:SAP domain-containing protein n=1 Tax=Byssothecium circinans TaxID=147558 RepID=A0A6A5TS77_9PLEO|nr:hypothetical protein CC80DRAFT_493002 [Byssothecium circinans]